MLRNNVAAIVTSLFDYVLEVKADIESRKEPVAIGDQVALLRKKLETIDFKQMPVTFSDTQLENLLLQSEEDLTKSSTQLSKLVTEHLQYPIRVENLQAAKDEFEAKSVRNEAILIKF